MTRLLRLPWLRKAAMSAASLATLAFILFVPPLRGADAPAPTPAAVTAPSLPPIPQSVFTYEDAAGRDPFFPRSTRRQAVVRDPSTPLVVTAAESLLYLRGVTGPPSNRVALVNNTPMKLGETNNVRLSDGRIVRVQVVEIRDQSVVVQLEGQAQSRELKIEER